MFLISLFQFSCGIIEFEDIDYDDSEHSSDVNDTSLADSTTNLSGTETNDTDTDKPTTDTQIIDTQTVDTQTVDTQTVDTQTVDTQTVDTQTVDSQTTDTQTEEPCPALPAGTDIYYDTDSGTDEFAYFGEVQVTWEGVSGQSFSGAIQSQTSYFTSLPEHAQVFVNFDNDLLTNDHLVLSFQINCVAATSGACKVGAMVEEAYAPWTNFVRYYISRNTGTGWVSYEVPFVMDGDFTTTNHITFHVGYPDQTIRIGDIRLVSYGQLAAYARPECLPDTTDIYSNISVASTPKTTALIDLEYLYTFEVNAIPSAGVVVSGLPTWLSFTEAGNYF